MLPLLSLFQCTMMCTNAEHEKAAAIVSFSHARCIRRTMRSCRFDAECRPLMQHMCRENVLKGLTKRGCFLKPRVSTLAYLTDRRRQRSEIPCHAHSKYHFAAVCILPSKVTTTPPPAPLSSRPPLIVATVIVDGLLRHGRYRLASGVETAAGRSGQWRSATYIHGLHGR